MTKPELIDWLVDWRQKAKGSISPTNHHRLLQTRTKVDLLRMYKQIREGERNAEKEQAS